MIIGIAGGGIVGRATARAFVEHAEVRVYDRDKRLGTHGAEEMLKADLVFVCVPEYAVEQFFADHGASGAAFVLKATVPIGTTRRLAERCCVVHSPEFLTARCAATDAHLPARNIVGGSAQPARTRLAELYSRRFPGVPLYFCTSDESEAVKLVCNAFFAVKVAFFNEANSLAEELGLDWGSVMRCVLSDGRIAHAHTRVPGPDGKYGFGGACLQKDLLLFAEALENAGLEAPVSRAAEARNWEDRSRRTGG